MTNEQLVESIQSGEDGLIPALWDQVQRFAYMKAGQYYFSRKDTCISCGVELEDLQQASYFGFLDAIKYYRKENEFTFLTYMDLPMKRHFNILCGLITKKQTLSPLNRCASLSAPLGDSDLALEDVLESKDEGSKDGSISAAEDRIWVEQLHAVLEDCLLKLPPLQATVIRARFYDCMSFRQIGERFGCTETAARSREMDGLIALRKGYAVKRLMPFREDIIDRYSFKGTGFAVWERTRTSSTEYMVLRIMDDKKWKY